MIVSTAKPKSFFLSLLMGMFFGPLSLFYFSFWGAMLMLALPVVGVLLFTHFYMDDNLMNLLRYPQTLMFWAGGYWLLSILCMLTLTYEYNVELGGNSDSSHLENHLSPQIRNWLRNHPGCNVNDYYKEQYEKVTWQEREADLQEVV